MANIGIPLAQWENLRREILWVRRGAVSSAFREHIFNPRDGQAAWWLIRGRVWLSTAEKRQEITHGHWILPGSGAVYRRYSPDAEILSIRFRIGWPCGASLFHQGVPLVLDRRGAGSLDRAGHLLAKVTGDNFPETGSLLSADVGGITRYLYLREAFEAWLRAYADCLIRAGCPPTVHPPFDERIAVVVAQMDMRLSQGIVPTEKELADLAGMSLSHFKRLFARSCQRSAKSWLDARRLEHATEALVASSKSVKQIAYSLGFRSPNNFSVWFRRKTGQQPHHYRVNLV